MANHKATPGSWTKGQSGNPKGRPRVPMWQRSPSTAKTAKERAERYAAPAFKLLAEAVQDKNAPMAARVSAANSILDRAFGKAPQDINIKGGLERHIIMLIQGLDAQQQDSLPSPAIVDATHTSLPTPRNGVESEPAQEPNDTNGLEP